MAKYVDEGHEVLVVSCTGGERGDILNPRLKDDIHILRDMPRVRRRRWLVPRRSSESSTPGSASSTAGCPRVTLPPLPDGCFALASSDVGGTECARSAASART